MTRWTSRGTALGVLLVGGLLGLLGSAQSWFSASGTGAGPEGSISFSGAEATGGLSQALPAVVLAGVLLTLVLARRGRRIVAVLVLCCGLAMAVLGALRTPPSAAAVRTRFRQIDLSDQFVLAGTGWPWLYLVAGLLVVGGAVLVWLGSPRWPRRSTRYERTTDVDATVVADDPASAWRALDAGVDPTLTGPSETPPEAVSESVPDTPSDARPLGAVDRAPDQTTTPGFDPDVRSGVVRDTMGPGQDQSSRRQDGDQ